MKILILGAGKMGSFFTDLLSFEHEVAVLESDPKRMRFIYNALRLQKPEEVAEFKPELVINCVTLSYTIEAFKSVMPYLQPYCIISDIASVKTHLKEFYETCGFPYVSTHPMFGPTFANLGQLEKENTIIISEGDHLGKIFFKDIYSSLRLHICEYTFEEHDKVVAYSLGIPFASTMVFAATMNNFQTSHEDSQRPAFRRRLSIDGNPFQPTHTSSDRTHPRGTGYLAGNYQKQRFGKNERIPDQDQEEYRIIQFNTPLSKIQSGNNKSFHSCESSSSHLWNNLFNDFIP